MRKLIVLFSASILLMIGSPAFASAPSNDDFSNATLVSSVPFNDSASVVDATVQSGEPNPNCEPVDHTIWYRFVAKTSMQVVVNVTGSDMPVAGGLYTGGSLSTLKNIGCLESFPPGTAVETKMAFPASAGTTYYIQLGKGTEGDNIGTIRVNIQRGGSIAGTVFASNHRPLNEA